MFVFILTAAHNQLWNFMYPQMCSWIRISWGGAPSHWGVPTLCGYFSAKMYNEIGFCWGGMHQLDLPHEFKLNYNCSCNCD